VSHPDLVRSGDEIELRASGRYPIDVATSIGAQVSVDGEAAPAIAIQRRVGAGFVDLPAGTRLRAVLFNASTGGLVAATVPGTSRLSILRRHPL
jgi:hypothetical protein